jgi:hypothetical protein
MILSTLDACIGRPAKSKATSLVAPLDFILTSLFMCAKSKATSLVAPLDFILTSLFHACVTL